MKATHILFPLAIILFIPYESNAIPQKKIMKKKPQVKASWTLNIWQFETHFWPKAKGNCKSSPLKAKCLVKRLKSLEKKAASFSNVEKNLKEINSSFK